MRICAVQTRPVKGDIAGNVAGHLRLIKRASARGADVALFPELSLTGYEPELAAALATSPDDPRFDALRRAADAANLTVVAGAPTRDGSDAGVRVSTWYQRAIGTCFAVVLGLCDMA